MDIVDTVYISCACNRSPYSVDWGRNNYICYAACNSVAIYNPQFSGSGKVLCTLHHHKSRVNAVKWIRHHDGSPETEFLSASSDCTAAVWSRSEEENNTYLPNSVLKGHSNIVTIIDGLYLSLQSSSSKSPSLLVATASVDNTLKLWRREENETEMNCIKTLDYASGFCLSLCFSLLPKSNIPLLAVGTYDSKINLFAECYEGKEVDHMSETVKSFSCVLSLTGHEDWVRGLDFTKDDSGNLLLASCGQDKLIRLWRIFALDDNDITAKRKKVSELDIHEDIELEKETFSVLCHEGGEKLYYFAVSCESILSGHEGWIYGIHWHPPVYCNNTEKWTYPVKLLSSSMDKTVVLWEPDTQSGVWLESMRVGEIGGNTLGFYGARFSPNGQSFIAHGFQGSFHLWNFCENTGMWKPEVTVGGHFDEVSDVQWEPDGQFLLSVSVDQTTRIHAPWIRPNNNVITWHELARPQVHGYDIQCLATISTFCFASGAEEKVIRCFKAPTNFFENVSSICNADIVDPHDTVLPHGASVPALGLSNKAVFKEEKKDNQQKNKNKRNAYPEFHFVPQKFEAPPTEENLIQNTLWPEIQKLYGHGYELFSLASRPDGNVLASACKATIAEHAAILLWDTDTWQQIDRLVSHQLTVTQLSFSPDGSKLLSVSRDRRWTLFKQSADNKYEMIGTSDKKTGIHTRIVWSCAWTPDSKYFATSSREGKVVVWEVTDSSDIKPPLGPVVPVPEPLDLDGHSVTAVAFAPFIKNNGSYILALGFEKGPICIYLWSPEGEETWTKCLDLNNNLGHHLTVKRLSFRPKVGFTSDTKEESQTVLYLASCGADNTVKIHKLLLKS